MENEYKNWIVELKKRINSAQLKASLAVNDEMIRLYWDIGKSIADNQKTYGWGSKVVEMAAADLKRDMPNTNGFSRTNLFEMRKFYLFYSTNKLVNEVTKPLNGEQEEIKKKKDNSKETSDNKSNRTDTEIVHQPGGQLETSTILTKVPWRHHIVILNKCKSISEAKFYLEQTIQNNWSRNILEMQIASKLIDRQGKAQNNFLNTLPKPQSD